MRKNYTYLIVLFLIVASCAAFGRIAGNDFINFDDNIYIVDNSHIKSGINPESIAWAFTSAPTKNWHPLTWLSHMLDWSVFGANPSGHHIVSLLLHIAAAIFLFLFLNKTTNTVWPSAFAAAFFALHPLRVESVAWAAERKDVLSMFFGMACIYAYTLYVENSKRSRYVVCLILFALSLLSKSMMVTLPFVFLLLDYWPLRRFPDQAAPVENRHLLFRLIREKIPFLILTILSSVITVWAQYEPNVAYPSLSLRFSNAIVAYVAHLEHIFYPLNLALIYYSEDVFTAFRIIVSGMILSVITLGVIYTLKKMPYFFVGWFWYLGTLIPVIGLLPTNVLIADHYTYLPSIGIAVMLAWGVPALISNERLRKRVLIPIAVFILVVLVCLTWRQCGYWKNSVALWTHAIRVREDNINAYLRLGDAYDQLGDNQRIIPLFDEVIRRQPNDYRFYNTRASIYYRLGQYQNAARDYSEAIRLKPDFAAAYNNRAIIYRVQDNKKSACEDAGKACELGKCQIMDADKSSGYCP